MNQLNKAIELREAGKAEEAKTILIKLVSDNPTDAQINYQCAWCHDVLGLENEAIPYYEKAIALGLPHEDSKEAYIGLGSTYRTVGEYAKSESILTEGVKLYDDNALKVFLAMTKYNLGKHAEAMEILLKLLSASSTDESIKKYKKAIGFYSDKLDQLW